MPFRVALLAATTILLTSCLGSPKLTPHVPYNDCPPANASLTPRKLAVFFDGTANDEASHTNISKLHNLVSLQARCDVNTLYVEGVGTDAKLVGGATGLGIGYRVREAYAWLGENYDATRGDSIFVFGFSRGAYSARILAAMVYAAGVPDLRRVPHRAVDRGVEAVYDAYKGEQDSLAVRARRSAAAMARIGWRAAPADVVFLGLFDTVEALGIATPFLGRIWPTGQHVEDTNERYGDQLCNVKRAAHAMSLDDNRAFIFTPKLLTRAHLTQQCPNRDSIDLDRVVNEVWFSGAHSDVGGTKGTELDDVPLNWMIRELAPYALMRADTVYADPFGRMSNPLATWGRRRLYGYRKRDIAEFIDSTDTRYNSARLKVHASVIRRLAADTIPRHWWQSEWHAHRVFAPCFEERVTSRPATEPAVVATSWIFVNGEGCRVDVVP